MKLGENGGKNEESVRILFCHNYEPYQLHSLLLQVGKTLIKGGIMFYLVLDERVEETITKYETKQ